MLYFDFAATTPPCPSVISVTGQKKDVFGNSNSLHGKGAEARTIFDAAQAKIAQLLGIKQGQVVFTHGGTDANQKIVHLFAKRYGFNRVFASNVEHSSVLDVILPENQLDWADMNKNIPPDAKLVCNMHSNNETGLIMPLIDKKEAFLLQDWVQSAGKVDFNWGNADFLSFSAHKFYGPKGIGFLAVKEPELWPELTKNHTINVHLAWQMAIALEWTLNQDKKHIQGLQKGFETGITQIFGENVRILHEDKQRIDGICSVAFKNTRGSEIMKQLSDEEGIFVSTGSACNKDLLSPSPVIQQFQNNSAFLYPIRVSFGYMNTKSDVDFLLEALAFYGKR